MPSVKFFHAPVASYNDAESFLVSLFGPDPFLGPAGGPGRTISAGLVYWPIHSDPDDESIAYRREALGCGFVLGLLGESEYAGVVAEFVTGEIPETPADVVEITYEQYMAVQPQPEM